MPVCCGRPEQREQGCGRQGVEHATRSETREVGVMSGVFGYEDACGERELLECPYSTCDGCPLRPDTGRLAGVPMVRVLDEDGRDVFGPCWYWRFPKAQGGAWFEGKTGEKEYVEGVVRMEPGNWGMSNRFVLTQVTPPHRIEVIEE